MSDVADEEGQGAEIPLESENDDSKIVEGTGDDATAGVDGDKTSGRSRSSSSNSSVGGTDYSDNLESKVEDVLNNSSIKAVITKERINRRLDLAFKGVGYVVWDAWDTAIKASLTGAGVNITVMSVGTNSGQLWAFAAILNLIVLVVAGLFIWWDRILFRKYLVPPRKEVDAEKRAVAQSFGGTVDTVSDVLLYWGAASLTEAVRATLSDADDPILFAWLYFSFVAFVSMFVVLGVRYVIRRMLHYVRVLLEKALLNKLDEAIKSVDISLNNSREAQLVRQETFTKLAKVLRGGFSWIGALAFVSAVSTTLVQSAGKTEEEQKNDLRFLWAYVGVAWLVTALLLLAFHRTNMKLYKKRCNGTKEEKADVLADVVLENVVTELRAFFSSLVVNVAAISFRDAVFITFLVVAGTSKPKPEALAGYFVVTLLVAAFLLTFAETILGRMERRMLAMKDDMDAKHKSLVDDDEISREVLFKISAIELYSNIVKLLASGFGLIVGGAFAKVISSLLNGPYLQSLAGLWIYAGVSGLLFFVLIPLLRNRINVGLCRLEIQAQKDEKEKLLKRSHEMRPVEKSDEIQAAGLNAHTDDTDYADRAADGPG